jgi:hypothetical protein
MTVGSWSLTKFWATCVTIWFLAASLLSVVGFSESLTLLALAFAFSPAFLAGSWAETHPEIAAWPRFRIIAMWVIAGAAWLAVGDTIDTWRLPAALVATPVTILTLRWYELTRGLSHTLPGRPSAPPELPPDTPPSTPLVG